MKLCECGCGREVKNRFVQGHNQIVNNLMKGKHPTVETRRKLSEAHKGKRHTREARKKISEATKGEKNPWYGKHHSIETKRKMSESHKGKPNPFKGKRHSVESKRKISEAGKVFARKYPKKVREMRRKGALITLTSLRQNSPHYIGDAGFDSEGERQAMVILCKKFNIVPKEGVNCHVRVNGGEIDFRPTENLFIEYHPSNWAGTLLDRHGLTSDQYYEQRRKLLDGNGFPNCKLIVVESLDELRKVLEVL